MPLNHPEELSSLIRQCPEMLDPAPAPADSDENTLRRRAQDEVHQCIRCGQPSAVSVIVEIANTLGRQAGPRWLDFCPDDYLWYRADFEKLDDGNLPS